MIQRYFWIVPLLGYLVVYWGENRIHRRNLEFLSKMKIYKSSSLGRLSLESLSLYILPFAFIENLLSIQIFGSTPLPAVVPLLAASLVLRLFVLQKMGHYSVPGQFWHPMAALGIGTRRVQVLQKIELVVRFVEGSLVFWMMGSLGSLGAYLLMYSVLSYKLMSRRTSQLARANI